MKSLVVILWLGFLLNTTNGDEECTFRDLEMALYKHENILQLSSAFFPVQQRTSRQIQVHYNFTGNETISACTVTYFWAVGGLLLIQPPKILRYTSLLFSFPSNNIEHISVNFPHHCQYLVYDKDTGACSCKHGHGDYMLNNLTHHLFQYAKYNCPDQLVRDETSAVRSVCSENLANFTERNIRYFFYFTLLMISIPLSVLLLLGVCSYRKTIEKTFSEQDKHSNLIGLWITGVYIIIFILGMDSAAVYYTIPDHNEYNNTNTTIETSVNFRITYATLGLDFLSIALYFVILGGYLVYKLSCKLKHYIEQRSSNQESHVQTGNPQHYNSVGGMQAGRSCHVQEWCLFCIIFPTCFCISTHLGYILAAWLTEPKKTTCIALFAIATILYLYLSFRKSYELFSWILSKIWNMILVLRCQNISDSKTISWLAHALSLLSGVPIIGILIAAVLAFYLLPIPALELTVYLENILEIILLFGAALISYKIFSFKESDAYIFLKNFLGSFITNPNQPTNATNSNEDDVFKESGEKVGIILKAVGEKCGANL